MLKIQTPVSVGPTPVHSLSCIAAAPHAFSSRRALKLVALCLLVLLPCMAWGAPVSAPFAAHFTGTTGVNFGQVNVATATPAGQSLTFVFDSAGSISAPSVVTQGAPNLDFTDAGTGSCTTNGIRHAYLTGDMCTVDVLFKPRAPGQRMGAVQLLDLSGNLLATGLVYGTGVGPQVSYSPTKSLVPDLGGNPIGVAVDSAGTVYVTDADRSTVAIVVTAGGATTVRQVGSGLYVPTSLAIDGSGNVFITDYASVKEILAAGGYLTTITLPVTFSSPYGVAVDGSGNVFVADYDFTSITELHPSDGYSTAQLLGSGLGGPVGVAVDGSGNLFVADNGTNSVKEILAAGGYQQTKILNASVPTPTGIVVDANEHVLVTTNAGGTLLEIGPQDNYATVKTLASGYNNSFGLALSSKGNIYLAGLANGGLYQLDYADPPSLKFGSTPAGSTSVDSPQTVTITNTGNAPLSFLTPNAGLNPAIGADFALENSSTCPLLSVQSLPATVAVGASCTEVISFKPTVTGTFAETLDTTSNVNVQSTQSIPVAGTSTTQASVLTSPSANSTLTGADVTFAWTPGVGVANTQLRVGNLPGHHEYFGTNPNTLSSALATGLPVDGRTLYVTLYSRINNAWVTSSSTVTAWTSPANIPAPATLISPVAGYALTGGGFGENFTWTAGVQVTSTALSIGSQYGRHDYFGMAPGQATSANVNGLPSDGRTLYISLYSRINNAWVTNQYTVTAAPGTAAVLTSPLPGASLGGASATFTWTAGTGVANTLLTIGKQFGQHDYFGTNPGQATSANVTGLPVDGRTLYVSLYSRINNAWVVTNSTVKAFDPNAPVAAVLISPTGNQFNSCQARQDFSWTQGSKVTATNLLIGTEPGGSEFFRSHSGTTTNATTGRINAGVIYVTLQSFINGNPVDVGYVFHDTCS